MASSAYDEHVAQASVKDDLGCDPGVGAAEEHREWVLFHRHLRPAGGVLAGVKHFAGNEAMVTFDECGEGLGRSELARHDSYASILSITSLRRRSEERRVGKVWRPGT